MTVAVTDQTESLSRDVSAPREAPPVVPNAAMAGREDRAADFSVERMAYAGILALALFVRLFALGNAPLSPLEAANAWPAWLQATGQTPVGAATITPGSASPLFYSGQLLLFWVAGGSDLWARFLPVVAGVAMVGLAWLLRERLGRSAALALAFLMAVDPWLVYFGRLGDGTIFGLFLGLLALIALDKARGAGARSWMWLQVLAVSSGLLVSSGPVGWSMVVVLLLNGALGGLPQGPWRDPEADTDRNLFELVALAGGALLLGATTWLGNPAGLAMVGTSLGWWLAQLVSRGQDGYPLTWAGIHWVTDQLLVLVFGAVGAVQLLRGRHHGAHPGRPRTGRLFLALWIAWGLLLILLPGRTPFALPILHLPLLLLAGVGVGALIDGYPSSINWRESGIVLLVCAALLLSALFWLRILLMMTQFDKVTAAVVLLLVISAGFVLAAHAIWSGWLSTRWLGGVLLFGVLMGVSLSSMWHLSQVHQPSRPDGLFRTETHPDVRNLAADVATLSAQRIGDAGEIPVLVQMAAAPDPVLGWNLRTMRRLSWVLEPDTALVNGRSPVVISLPAQTLMTDANYLGSAYKIRTGWLPSALLAGEGAPLDLPDQTGFFQRLDYRFSVFWSARLRSMLRWMVYHEVPELPEMEERTLWVEELISSQ